MLDLVIYGAGGLGRELRALVRAVDPEQKKWRFLGYADDALPAGHAVGNGSVLGDRNWLAAVTRPTAVVFGVASPPVKATLHAVLAPNPKVSFPVLIHPRAWVEPSASLAPGAVVAPFCFVAVDAHLGTGVFLNSGSQVGHDTRVGDYSSVMPSANISGNVSVGAQTLIGAGAKILQGLTVGSNSTVGIGSVVLTHVPDDCTVMGYPAKRVSIAPKIPEHS